MRYRLFLAVLVALFLSACSLIKTISRLKSGEVAQKSFVKEIPFTEIDNIIIFEARVNGSAKPYRFIFDTGAPNVITPALAKELGLISGGEIKVSDSGEKKENLGNVMLDSVSIAGITFAKTLAFISDINKQPEIACFGADGIIGANLMRKAHWRIDYARKRITFTDELQKLSIPAGAVRVPFTPDTQGTPFITYTAGEVKGDLAIDTGKNSEYISFSKKKEPPFTGLSIVKEGRASVGAFGARNDTTYFRRAKEVKSGPWELGDIVYMTSEKSRPLLGSGFLSRTCNSFVLDWKNNLLHLDLKNEIPAQTFQTQGAGISAAEGKWFVANITYPEGKRSEVPVNVGEEVKAIDGKAVSAMDYCAWAAGANDYIKTMNKMRLRILRDGKEENIELERRALIK